MLVISIHLYKKKRTAGTFAGFHQSILPSHQCLLLKVSPSATQCVQLAQIIPLLYLSAEFFIGVEYDQLEHKQIVVNSANRR